MPLICWDLDETLGYFRPVAAELVRRYHASQRGLLARLGERLGLVRDEVPGLEDQEGPPVRLRAGIAEVLADLRAAGYTQVVTTGSLQEYAELSLERVGLRGAFEGVFGRETVWEGHGKVYSDVLRRFDATPDEALIVGDDFKRDHASDWPEIVLICQPEGLEEPAPPLATAIKALGECGSFAAGFQRLYARSRVEELTRYVDLPGDLRASLEYWGDYRRGEKTPVVSALRPLPEA